MAIVLVTYDLKQSGRNYQPIFDYLKKYTYCKGLESVWLLDTSVPVTTIRDHLKQLIDSNDVVFVAQLSRNWAAVRYGCGDWLNKPERSW